MCKILNAASFFYILHIWICIWEREREREREREQKQILVNLLKTITVYGALMIKSGENFRLGSKT